MTPKVMIVVLSWAIFLAACSAAHKEHAAATERLILQAQFEELLAKEQ